MVLLLNLRGCFLSTYLRFFIRLSICCLSTDSTRIILLVSSEKDFKNSLLIFFEYSSFPALCPLMYVYDITFAKKEVKLNSLILSILAFLYLQSNPMIVLEFIVSSSTTVACSARTVSFNKFASRQLVIMSFAISNFSSVSHCEKFSFALSVISLTQFFILLIAASLRFSP